MQTYLETVRVSILVFPFLAMLSLIPFVFYHYKKHGYVDQFRAIVFYLFMFYCIAAWLMTVLPLPTITENFCELRKANTTPRWIPFQFIKEMISELGGNITISRVLRSGNFMVTAFNVLLLFPLGFFLRYLYKFKLRTAVSIGFLVSLFFEITQITGIYGLYPCPYRLFEVDDLMTNTTGTLLGFLAAGYATFLPDTRVEPLVKKEANLTVRFLAFLLDLFVVSLLTGLFVNEGDGNNLHYFIISTLGYLLYFVVLPLTKFKNTFGKKMFGLRIVSQSEEAVSAKSLLIRYGVLFIFPTFLSYFSNYLIETIPNNGIYGLLYLLLLMAWFVLVFGLAIFRKNKLGLHDILAKTKQLV